jgi:hypothetical protein
MGRVRLIEVPGGVAYAVGRRSLWRTAFAE